MTMSASIEIVESKIAELVSLGAVALGEIPERTTDKIDIDGATYKLLTVRVAKANGCCDPPLLGDSG